MNGKDLYQRISVIFGSLMVFFYLGFGVFFIISPLFSNIDKFLRIIFGSAFLLIGLARAFRTYEKIREVFFSEHDKSG